MTQLTQEPKERSKAVYLVPNLFTTGALFCGFYSVVAAMHGDFASAATAIFIAMIFDGFDGRVARLVNCESEFGAQYDSLSDLVAFGIAPSVVALSWSLTELGKVGWMAAFIYVVCAALRLARFNTQIGIVDKNYFVGLASPPAAALIAAMVWSGSLMEIDGNDLSVLVAVIVAGTGLLMVSNLKYYSFKGLDIKGRVPFVALLAIIVAGAVIFIDPARILFLCAFTYALSGPFMYLLKRYRDKKLKPVPVDVSDKDQQA